jgi:hypothetical protein
VIQHRFDGQPCSCGVRHRVFKVAPPAPVRKPRGPKNSTGPVKATPALVAYIRVAAALARADGDRWVRTAHLLKAIGVYR